MKQEIKFHPQINEMQSFTTVECFPIKTPKFWQADAIIYDVSVDFEFCFYVE